MPPCFDVGRVDAQRLFRQLPLTRMRHVENPTLRIQPPRRQRDRPREHEVTDGAEMEDEDVSLGLHGSTRNVPGPRYSWRTGNRTGSSSTGKRIYSFAASIHPPPSTTSPSYSTTACPGVIAACGSSNRTTISSAPVIVTLA